MSTTVMPFLSDPVREPAPARTRGPVVPVFLPKEHGSWSLALEPLALGLLLAPSWAGGALAGAVLAGFFARRPFKAAGTAHPARRVAAREALVMWTALAVAGLFEAGVLGGWDALRPLLAAVPCGALFVWCDAQNNSRATAAEVAGSAAFAFVPVAVATLAGWPAESAGVLAVLVLARSVPAVLVVRSFLRAAKGGPARPALALAASFLAWAALGALTLAGRAPQSAAWLGLLLFVRTLWYAGPWRPAWPARRIGQGEAGLGLLYVLLLFATWPST